MEVVVWKRKKEGLGEMLESYTSHLFTHDRLLHKVGMVGLLFKKVPKIGRQPHNSNSGILCV